MDRSWKILLAVVVVAIIWFSWQKAQEESERGRRVRALADCFNQADYKPRSPRENVRANFFKALAQLHQNVADEPAADFLHRGKHDTTWYLDEALDPIPLPDPERLLLKNAIVNGYADARAAGAFDQAAGREAMAAGREPIITKGSFAGEPLRIGWRVSPVLIPEIINHPANFKLMPAVAWGLQQERIDDASVSAARELHQAGILSLAGWELVQGYHREARKKD